MEQRTGRGVKYNTGGQKLPRLQECAAGALHRFERACKPGSVFDGHLSGTHVAARLKPPPRDSRAGLMSLHGVAPDRVYSTGLSPADGRALISAFPPLPGRARRYISVALVRGSPLAGVTRYPCPVEPGLSSRDSFRSARAAVRPARIHIVNSAARLVKRADIKLLCSEPARFIIMG